MRACSIVSRYVPKLHISNGKTYSTFANEMTILQGFVARILGYSDYMRIL